MNEVNDLFALPADCSEEEIRQRYLELVKQFPPEQHPAKFTQIRAAYESMRDLTTRASTLVFDTGKNESLDTIIQELSCRSSQRPRISMARLYKQLLP